MRHGPVHTLPGGLAVTSPTGLHVRLTPAGVAHHRAEEALAVFDWDDVAAVSLRLPGSWFPYPGAAATIGYGVLTLLSQEVEAPPHEESTIRIAFTGGASEDLPVTHAPGGYWRRAIARAELLIGQFIDNPATRALLDHPEHIMRRYIASTRWRIHP